MKQNTEGSNFLNHKKKFDLNLLSKTNYKCGLKTF